MLKHMKTIWTVSKGKTLYINLGLYHLDSVTFKFYMVVSCESNSSSENKVNFNSPAFQCLLNYERGALKKKICL